MIYLSQSFEKANKSPLALIKTEYLGEQETILEEYFTKNVGHDKKKTTNQLIKFFKGNDSNLDFDKVNEKLMTSVKYYKPFQSIKDFYTLVNEDFATWTGLRSPPKAESDFLHQSYYHSNKCKYQIICYLLRRYFNEIETNVRYPTESNDYTVNNPFNTKENKEPLKKIIRRMYNRVN